MHKYMDMFIKLTKYIDNTKIAHSINAQVFIKELYHEYIRLLAVT